MKEGQSSQEGSALVPVDQLEGVSEFETMLLRSYLEDARTFLEGFAWCTELREQRFGIGVGGVIAVFLMEVVVKGQEREWLWVVAGDLPVAYFAAARADTPCEALVEYCHLVERWVAAVRAGALNREVFALPVMATVEVAAVLAAKLETLRRIILPALCPPVSSSA